MVQFQKPAQTCGTDRQAAWKIWRDKESKRLPFSALFFDGAMGADPLGAKRKGGNPV